MKIRTVESGSYAAAKPKSPEAMLATDDAAYARLWSSIAGGDTRPPVDFAKESVVFLLAGSKPTGGWSIEPRGAMLDGDTLVIDAVIKGPPPGGIVTQAFTSPFAVVAVDTRNAKDVRWAQ